MKAIGNPVDVLTGARPYIEQGWTQGAYARNEGKDERLQSLPMKPPAFV